MFIPIRKMISFIVHFIRKHFLIIICCVITALLWDKLRLNTFGRHETASVKSKSDQRLLTVDELAKFDGIHNNELYLAILGSVYDVTKGAKHYGAGGSYNYFVGKQQERKKMMQKNEEKHNLHCSRLSVNVVNSPGNQRANSSGNYS